MTYLALLLFLSTPHSKNPLPFSELNRLQAPPFNHHHRRLALKALPEQKMDLGWYLIHHVLFVKGFFTSLGNLYAHCRQISQHFWCERCRRTMSREFQVPGVLET